MDNCDKKYHAKGYCSRHYKQYWKTGSPEIIRPNPNGTPEERFWRHVEKGSNNECWEWTAYKDKDGYGSLKIDYSTVRAHRFSYELHKKPIPEGMLVRHLCNNPSCVNPTHLKLGDHDKNMKDRVKSGNYYTGEDHPNAKIADDAVISIYEAEGTHQEIADRFGVSATQVGNIKRGDQRSDVTRTVEVAE